MAKAYTEELIFTESEDGLALEGVAIHPHETASNSVTIVWIHGNTSNFYSYAYILIGRALVEQGFTFISGNTRGHDVSTSLWNIKENRPVGAGSGWERYEDAPYDVAAWVDYAAKLNVRGVALIGHSQGAAKVTYYQGLREDKRILGLGLASPDLRGHWNNLVEKAQQLANSGHGDELLTPFSNSMWYGLSADNILSRERILSNVYTVEGQITAINCPILAFFGTDDVGGKSELSTLRQHARNTARLETHIINGDHVYTDYEKETADLIAAWAKGL